MREIKDFSECDGHVESILIGCGETKVSFQTWNAKKLVLIYYDVEQVTECHAVFPDISAYTKTQAENGLTQFDFIDVDDMLVLRIVAKSVKMYEVGEDAEVSSALFHVGYDYIGNQSADEGELHCSDSVK